MDIIKAGQRRRLSWRALVYGKPGIGKTTFGAQAPTPILFDLEDGGEFVHIDRTPLLKTYEDFFSALQWFYSSEYETAVIDSLDVLEQYIFASVCAQNNWKSIESPKYGHGYKVAKDVWNKIMGAWDMCAANSKNILCIGHEKLRTINSGDSDSYDSWDIKLNQEVANLIVAKMDYVFYAQLEKVIVDDKGKAENKRAITNGTRLLRTATTAAHTAKSRIQLCDPEPMDGRIFAKMNGGI
jgi:hypothetical protein